MLARGSGCSPTRRDGSESRAKRPIVGTISPGVGLATTQAHESTSRGYHRGSGPYWSVERGSRELATSTQAVLARLGSSGASPMLLARIMLAVIFVMLAAGLGYSYVLSLE